MKSYTSTCLRHHVLIAVSQVANPNFARILTDIVEYTASGAMGIAINQSTELNLEDFFE